MRARFSFLLTLSTKVDVESILFAQGTLVRTRSAAPSGVGPSPIVELHYDRTPVDEARISFAGRRQLQYAYRTEPVYTQVMLFCGFSCPTRTSNKLYYSSFGISRY